MVKRCTRCRQDKPAEDFGRNPLKHDGLQPWCRACAASYRRERYAADAGRRSYEYQLATARRRALASLVDRHRAEFEALYADALARSGSTVRPRSKAVA
jgi:hypothetical protein